ncbi:MAG: tyrosine-type recombinase/integrase [Anaerolineae bacterium]|nr:tyrosine-type recombinase/integrase [Anaerolineae bacterium]
MSEKQLDTKVIARDLYMEWITNLTSKKTQLAYDRTIRNFAASVYGKDITDMSKQDCINYRDYLIEKEYSNATINNNLSAISSFFNYCVENGHLASNPMNGIKRMKVEPYGKTTMLNPATNQDAKLLKSINLKGKNGLRDYAVIRLLISTGVRVSAIADARIKDIVQRNGFYYLRYKNKGGTSQLKKIGNNTFAAIKAYLEDRGLVSETDYLFAPSRKNETGKFSRTAITNMIVKRAKEANLHHITAHSLRHTSALKVLANNGDLRDVQKHLQHKDPRITLIYIEHLQDIDNDAMVDSLDDSLD